MATLWPLGHAGIATVEDQEMVGVLQVFGGYRREQGLFDGQGRFTGDAGTAHHRRGENRADIW